MAVMPSSSARRRMDSPLIKLPTPYRVEVCILDAPAIVCEDLCKRYRKVTALNGFGLVARQGAVYGLLGPNGAGKTTAVRILATLPCPDSGRAEVAGFDVASQPDQVRARIGVAGQN